MASAAIAAAGAPASMRRGTGYKVSAPPGGVSNINLGWDTPTPTTSSSRPNSRPTQQQQQMYHHNHHQQATPVMSGRQRSNLNHAEEAARYVLNDPLPPAGSSGRGSQNQPEQRSSGTVGEGGRSSVTSSTADTHVTRLPSDAGSNPNNNQQQNRFSDSTNNSVVAPLPLPATENNLRYPPQQQSSSTGYGNSQSFFNGYSAYDGSNKRISSNCYANGNSQNTGNYITSRATTRVIRPPGGISTISLG